MKRLAAILVVLFSINVSAQEIKKTQDLGMWFEASLKHKFKDNYSLTFSQEFRLYESFSEVEKYILDVGLDYKINRNFKIGANIRYSINKRSDKTNSQDWRYNFDFKYKNKLGDRFIIEYRLRYQNNYCDLFTPVSKGNKANIRNKLKLDYKINKKNTAYFSGEIFREVVNYREPYFNQFRLAIGNEIETKVGEFDFSLRYERELNSNYPLDFIYLKVSYTFNLNK